jgi:hypothetical protein
MENQIIMAESKLEECQLALTKVNSEHKRLLDQFTSLLELAKLYVPEILLKPFLKEGEN